MARNLGRRSTPNARCGLWSAFPQAESSTSPPEVSRGIRSKRAGRTAHDSPAHAWRWLDDGCGMGGLTSSNDGTVIVSISSSAVMQSVLGGRNVARALSWLGSIESTTRVCIAFAETGVRSLDDAARRGLVIGATGAGSPISDYAAMVRNTLGGSFKVVPGYAGTAALALAMERREIDAVCGTSLEAIKSERPEWLSKGMLNFLLAFSRRTHDVPNVPSFLDLVSESTGLQLNFWWRKKISRALTRRRPAFPLRGLGFKASV